MAGSRVIRAGASGNGMSAQSISWRSKAATTPVLSSDRTRRSTFGAVARSRFINGTNDREGMRFVGIEPTGRCKHGVRAVENIGNDWGQGVCTRGRFDAFGVTH